MEGLDGKYMIIRYAAERNRRLRKNRISQDILIFGPFYNMFIYTRFFYLRPKIQFFTPILGKCSVLAYCVFLPEPERLTKSYSSSFDKRLRTCFSVNANSEGINKHFLVI